MSEIAVLEARVAKLHADVDYFYDKASEAEDNLNEAHYEIRLLVEEIKGIEEEVTTLKASGET